MPSRHADSSPDSYLPLRLEPDSLRYVKERTTIPVPRVFGYIASEDIGAPVMLMECLPGNVGRVMNFNFVQDKHEVSFYEEMAQIQTDVSSMLLPRIGCIVRLEDGNYEVGPIPGLGGQFDTAQEYIKMWAAKTLYAHSVAKIKDACGNLGVEMVGSTSEFPGKLRRLAKRHCATGRNRGPFPFCHVDFGHNNTIVDDEYRVLGIIDREHAYAAPWETIDFPLTLLEVSAPMDVPWNYDEHWVPTDEAARKNRADPKEYIAAVRRAEARRGLPSTLSDVLADESGQNLATAMRLYAIDGKMGFCPKVLDHVQ